MRNCKACSKAKRKTVRAFVTGEGLALVCEDCARRGVLVVPKAVPAAPAPDDDPLADVKRLRRRMQQVAARLMGSAALAATRGRDDEADLYRHASDAITRELAQFDGKG